MFVSLREDESTDVTLAGRLSEAEEKIKLLQSCERLKIHSEASVSRTHPLVFERKRLPLLSSSSALKSAQAELLDLRCKYSQDMSNKYVHLARPQMQPPGSESAFF